MATDLGLFHTEGATGAAQTPMTPVSSGGLVLLITGTWANLRAAQKARQINAQLKADLKRMKQAAPHMVADLGLVDRATAASIRRMENAAARSMGLSRHSFISKL